MSQFDHESEDQSAACNELVRDLKRNSKKEPGPWTKMFNEDPGAAYDAIVKTIHAEAMILCAMELVGPESVADLVKRMTEGDTLPVLSTVLGAKKK